MASLSDSQPPSELPATWGWPSPSSASSATTQHGWPSLAMSRALSREHSAGGDYVGYIPAQLVYPGPLALPIVILGIVLLARRRELRFVVVAYALVVAFVFIDVPGRAYYPSGFYPLLFAAGAVAVDGAPPRTAARTWPPPFSVRWRRSFLSFRCSRCTRWRSSAFSTSSPTTRARPSGGRR